MPARINVDQSLVSARLVEHLRGALDLTANRCYETIDPLGIQAAPGGDYWVTVAPADGQFDESFQEGGGADQLVEDAEFTITAFVRVALDETGHDERLLHDPNRGLLTVKKKLLAALAIFGVPPTRAASIGAMAAFELPAVSGGSDCAARRGCRPTVARSMPSAAAMRRRDQRWA